MPRRWVTRKREYLEQAGAADILPHVWQPRFLKWTVAITRKGGMVRDGIPTTQALTEDVAASLPGEPTAIPTPGHTGGHCSYVVDGVLVSGDALVTGHPLLASNGPQLLPELFNHDQDGCVRSLAALGMLDTDVLLPGHGPVWRGSVRDAAEPAGHGAMSFAPTAGRYGSTGAAWLRAPNAHRRPSARRESRSRAGRWR